MSDSSHEEMTDKVGQAVPFATARPQFYIRVTPPFWSRVLLGVNLLIFVAMVIYGIVVYNDYDGTTNGRVLTTFGMKVNELVANGEPWRLFTAMFLHIGVIHLLSNLYALYILGPMVEGYYGRARFLVIYLLGGLTGSVASYAFSDAASAGASGAVFALVGAITVYFLRYRENFGARGRAILQNMFVVIAINLIFGLSVPFIDNWGHIGGLVGGAILAWGVLPRYQPPAMITVGPQPIAEENRISQEVAWSFVWLAVLWFSTQYISTIRPSGF